jgi:hypothetical protein
MRDLLVLHVVHLKVVLTRTRQGQIMHVSTNVFRVPHTARKLAAKRRAEWGCGGISRGGCCARYLFNDHGIECGSRVGYLLYNGGSLKKRGQSGETA